MMASVKNLHRVNDKNYLIHHVRVNEAMRITFFWQVREMEMMHDDENGSLLSLAIRSGRVDMFNTVMAAVDHDLSSSEARNENVQKTL